MAEPSLPVAHTNQKPPHAVIWPLSCVVPSALAIFSSICFISMVYHLPNSLDSVKRKVTVGRAVPGGYVWIVPLCAS